MDDWKDTAVEAVLEQLTETCPTDIASVFARAFEPAMRIERERFLGAGHHERTPERRGHANATLPKRIDTPAGTVTVQVPETAGHERARLSPQSLERGPPLGAGVRRRNGSRSAGKRATGAFPCPPHRFRIFLTAEMYTKG